MPQRHGGEAHREGPSYDDEQRQRAARHALIAAHESRLHANPLTLLTRRLSHTAWFAEAYRRIGPRVDPTLRKVRDGRLLAAIYGFPFLTLHTTGARSGAPRTSPLLYVRDDAGDVVVLGTNFGQPSHPAWTANLLAHPAAAIDIGPVRLDVRADLVDAADPAWAASFARFVAIYPGYADYLERRGDLAPRMFRLRATD